MKNLIYYSLGGSPEYLYMFLLHLKTLYQYDDLGLDILVITNDQFAAGVREKQIPCQFHITKTDTVLSASSSKLKIHEYDYSAYDKILYCDIDTVWVDKVSRVFDKINTNKIHVHTIPGLMSSSDYTGARMFTEQEKEFIQSNNIRPINAGVFGFKSTMRKDFFTDVEAFISNNKDFANACLEQPYFNVVIYRQDLWEDNLGDVVTCRINVGCEHPALMHFEGAPGHGRNKIQQMKAYINDNSGK